DDDPQQGLVRHRFLPPARWSSRSTDVSFAQCSLYLSARDRASRRGSGPSRSRGRRREHARAGAGCGVAGGGRIVQTDANASITEVPMAWDFSTEPEFQKKLDWVEEFCREEVEPLDLVFPYAVRSPDPKIKALVKGLQDQIKDQGLWAIFLDKELGGPGHGQLQLALLNEILGRYGSAPAMFGCAAPDTGNMEMLAAYGTEEQKERWLKPLLNQEIFSAYSMTEPQGGSDPNLFKTRAVRDGDEWVINGEKWFTSAGRVADI